MPPRRSRSSLRRKPVDQEKENAIKQMKENFDKQLQELMKLYDDVDTNIIFKCKHPLEILSNEIDEERGRNKVATLTPIQRAITFCIQHNGGSATDDEVLAFIHRFWSIIVAYGQRGDNGITYQYTKPIDKRVLHINFSTAKIDNRPLFIKIEENRYKLNAPINNGSTKNENKSIGSIDSTNNTDNSSNKSASSSQSATDSSRSSQRISMNSRNMNSRNYNSNSSNTNSNSYSINARSSTRLGFNNNSRDSTAFQDKIIEILKSAKNQSLTIDEIVNKAKELESNEEFYPNLSLEKRVKCCLEMKKIVKEVVYDENTLKWSIQTKPIEKQKNSLPKELKGVRIREMSVNELWSLLKEKRIY